MNVKVKSYKNIKNNTVSIAFMLVIVTLVSKLTGFLREYALASSFGTGFEADAYIVALNVPTVLFTTFLIAVTNCFIPQYNYIKTHQGEKESNKFTNNIITIMIIISIVTTIFVIKFPEFIVNIFGSGFNGESYDLAIILTRIASIAMISMPMTHIYSAFLQSNDNAIIPAGNNIIYNIFIIIAFIFSNELTIIDIMIVSTCLFFTQIVVQYPFTRKLGLRYKPTITIDNNTKKLIKLLIPILMSTAVLEINTLIDKSIATNLVEGSVSSLNYAKKLSDFVFGIISVSISSIIYPRLTRCFAENKIDEFKSLYSKSFEIISIFTIPTLLFVMFFCKDIVSLIYGYGNFDTKAIDMTSIALFYYATGMVFMSLRDILNKVFYSIHDTKTPMCNSIFATIINIILNFILVKNMQHGGLALASSISMAITTFLLIYSLSKQIKINYKNIIFNILKSMVTSIVLIYLSKLVYSNIQVTSKFIQLLLITIIILINFISYILICNKLGIECISNFFNTIKNRKLCKIH